MAKRIGIHLGTTGGASNAVERAREVGADTFQIFSASPRMWRAPKVDPAQAKRMGELRAKLDIGPLVIHTGYLINICSQSSEIREKSIAGFRGEIERALILGAEYLVLHPGSWKGLTRDEGLKLAADSIKRAIDGLPWQGTPFHILIENTAGAEFSLGGSFEQVAELVARLKSHAPVAVCLDTCHTHVAGYDMVSAKGRSESRGILPAYDGEIAVNPATGAVLRLSLIGDMTATPALPNQSATRRTPNNGVHLTHSLHRSGFIWARSALSKR